MQLISRSYYRDKIAQLKAQRISTHEFQTVRGNIVDRKGRILATDEPEFQLHINYQLTQYADERVQRAALLRARRRPDAQAAVAGVQNDFAEGQSRLQTVIEKCVQFGAEHEKIADTIDDINNRVWNIRQFIAWIRNEPDERVLQAHGSISSIPASVAVAAFADQFPDEQQQLLLTAAVSDIPEMRDNWPLLDLETDDDTFTAQLEFLDIDGVEIKPRGKRHYPYGSAAAQTIGWVGPATEAFELDWDDELQSYMPGDVCGRRPGAEYICEALLRGRRGMVVYDIDRQLIRRTEPQLGEDIKLTLDIELQSDIENLLLDWPHDPNCSDRMAAVVMDVQTAEILAMVSLPSYDLNRVRHDYNELISDANEPMINKAINKQYPPGSIIKQLILIAGLESGKVTPDEVISCPPRAAPRGWPNCWIFNRYGWLGHDDQWENNGRNALKGSCNIYFSQLASRIEPEELQQWLLNFGFGRRFELAPQSVRNSTARRDFHTAPGIISTGPGQDGRPGPLRRNELRWFGIGQGNLRVTPLQVVTSTATMARGGMFAQPRLFIEDDNEPPNWQSIDMSPRTVDVVRDGTYAVVNERGGTAFNVFEETDFGKLDVTVYGKTGTTQAPSNAWFEGFAEDSDGRAVSVAVIIEQGRSGANDAGPLAREIIKFCIERGYLGQMPEPEQEDTEIAQSL